MQHRTMTSIGRMIFLAGSATVVVFLICGIAIRLHEYDSRAALAASAKPTATPTIANSRGDCPSLPIDSRVFEAHKLTRDQVSFIMNAVHRARPTDRGQLRWASISGNVLVFMPLEGWSPMVVLADQPTLAFDASYRNKDAGHEVYITNQGPGAQCTVHAVNPIGQ